MARRPFVVVPSLTAIAIGYRNDAATFIADDVLPRMPVYGESFKWTEFPLAEGFRAPDNRVGRTGRVNRVEFSSEERTSAVENFGLEAPIPISDIEEAERMRSQNLGNADPEGDAVALLTHYNLINRERRVAALVQNPGLYPAGLRLALAGSDQFSDFASSDPIDTIKTAMGSLLVHRPNQVTMSFKTWDKIRSHPKLIRAVKGGLTDEGMITREQFAALFDLKKVLIGEAYLDTARFGQAPDIRRIWGNDMVFQFINPAPARGSVTHGFTATYGTKFAGRYEDENVGLEGGRVIREGEKLKELIVAPGAGFLLQDVVAE
ncbi:capsid protein [Aureimonas sp. SK2]|uniref:capsid protein n=1 Tax=Aureimonas sp. SK2 TaxID=3015992 RepID=UPI002444E49A|nr:capsid protein [Aureimonas sp. SK2]